MSDKKTPSRWTDAQRLRRMQKLLELPPIKWDAAFARLPEAERQDLVRQLEGQALRTAELATYLDQRTNGNDHAGAVKQLLRTTKAVWCKAFGYNHAWELRF